MKKNISDKVQLGQTGILVSPVGCGVLPMGPGQLALPVEEGAKLICYALSKGINFIDTAQYYKTYPYIRRALEMLESRSEEADGAHAAAGSADDLRANFVSAAGEAGTPCHALTHPAAVQMPQAPCRIPTFRAR